MKKHILKLVVLGALFFAFAGCGIQGNSDHNTNPSSTDNAKYFEESENTFSTQMQSVTSSEQPQESEITFTEAVSDSIEITPPATVPTPSSEPEEENTTLPQTTKTYEKTGEMAFSDDKNNRYIDAVSQKYGVNSENLVALYTVPENDSNLVLEFDGSKNADGTPIRNKSTLIAIYSIDKALNSKRASEDRKLNEYSFGEMKVMFFSTTTYIMPEFEELK